ncbi:MAG: TIR domain-containing protein, partial [Dehalococcoidia bacterium]
QQAMRIADALEAAGIRVWLDRRSIAGGSSWDASIVQAITHCSVFLLLASGRSTTSPNVVQELRLAWDEQRPALPLLAEPVSFPDEMRYILTGRQWIELLDHPEADWLPEMLRALAGLGLTPAIAPLADVAASGAAPRPLGNLPTPLTSFIGREHELVEITTLLDSTRLLTLTGPGGTGKTRLAIAAGRQVAARYPDGGWFVDLSGVSNPTGVVLAIAQVLGVVESDGRSLAVSVAAYLRHKHLLLVLDNFEQVIAAALQVYDLVVEAPSLVVLVTSRVLLRVAGEQAYLVPPLPLPDPDRSSAVVPLADNPAVQLFVQRTRALRPEFTLSPENAVTIAAICARLDGLPLAIELAAARSRLLTPAALLARLEHRLPLLTGGERSRPERQQTLRGAVQWSWELLEPAEQELFRRVSVFAGGWTLETAETVCNPVADLDVFGGLESLVDKSLVRQIEVDGEPRFTMLATLREFALEQLEAGGDDQVLNRRHAERFGALAERALVETWASGHVLADYVRPLEAEWENLLAALQWTLAHAEAELGLALVGGLNFWFYLRAPGEGLRWAEALLALPAGGEPTRSRAMALYCAGACAFAMGRHELGHAYMDAAAALFRVCEDLPYLSQALAITSVFLPLTEAEQALKTSDEALTMARATGAPAFIIFAEWVAGTCRLIHASDLAAARTHFEEALRLARTLDGDWHTMFTLFRLAQVAQQQGQGEEAMRLYLEARPLAEVLGDRSFVARTSIELALLAAVGDDQGRAAAEWGRGLHAARELSSAPLSAVCLAGVAGLLAGRGEAAGAATLLGASARVWRDEQQPDFDGHAYRQAHEPALAAIQAALSVRAFALAWAEGEALSLDDAVTLGLDSLSPTRR